MMNAIITNFKIFTFCGGILKRFIFGPALAISDGSSDADSVRPMLPWLVLLLIAALLAAFYAVYLSYFDGFPFVHYYEYYTRSVVIADELMRCDFAAALQHHWESYVDKILHFRTVPFFLLFGASPFVFFYSNVIFNLALWLFLFHLLLKVMPVRKAFFFCLLLSSQYFFIELLASFYVDLNYFFMCAYFFIYLSLFDKNPRHCNVTLAIIVFLLFLTKNVSYGLVPVCAVAMVLYILLTKERKIEYLARFIAILSAGFLAYYWICLAGDTTMLLNDLHADVWSNLFLNATWNDFVFNKFPVPWLNVAIYPIVLLVSWKRREAFWFLLFLVSEAVLFSLFNIKGHHHEWRFYLPFYFVYLYFAYELLFPCVNKAGRTWAAALLACAYAVLFITGFLRLMNTAQFPLYAHCRQCHPIGLSSHIRPNSTVGLLNPDYYPYLGSFIDSDERDYSHLMALHPRFNYRVLDTKDDADYLLGGDLQLEAPPSDYRKVYSFNRFALYAKIRGANQVQP